MSAADEILKLSMDVVGHWSRLKGTDSLCYSTSVYLVKMNVVGLFLNTPFSFTRLARIWCKVYETKRKYKGDTKILCNSLYIRYSNCGAVAPEYAEYTKTVLLHRKPHGVECQEFMWLSLSDLEKWTVGFRGARGALEV